MLIDFWTYTCINCIRTLPYLRAWDGEYRDDGLTIVGVHSPEFAFEKDAGNVADAIDENGIDYPVVQDNELGTWNAFGNQYWPAKYLIDADGEVRYVHFGEGAYDADREGDPLAARRGGRRRARRAGASRGARCSGSTRGCARPRPTSARRAPRAGSSGPQPGRQRLRRARPGVAGAQPVRLRRRAGTSTTRRRPRRLRRRSRSRSRPGGCSSCSARPTGPRRVEVLLDGKPIPDARRRRRRPRRRRRRSPASASTGSSTCREAGRAHARAALRARRSRATRSRSASAARSSRAEDVGGEDPVVGARTRRRSRSRCARSSAPAAR